MRANLVAGLDIGSTKTCAVIAEVIPDPARGAALKILGVGQARTGGMRREVVTDIEETTDFQLMKEARERAFADCLTPREQNILSLDYGLEDGVESDAA